MIQLFFCSLLFIFACSNNNTATDSQAADNPPTEKQSETPANSSVEGDGIVGEWEMIGFVSDTNDNLLIDEAERANLKKASFKNYMKLNSDGTGLFTVARMEGRYEIKSGQNDSKKFMTWYDKADGRHRIGTIIAVSKDELHIKEPGGNGLFIWKRLS